MKVLDKYESWLQQYVGNDYSPQARFVLKIATRTAAGQASIDFEFDLAWYILLNIDAAPELKVEVVEAILAVDEYADNFRSTINNRTVKRVLEEFLLFNFDYLDALKEHIDFSELDVPLDFISHALFIKRSLDGDTAEIMAERLRTVDLVLNQGFKLRDLLKPKDSGAAVAKVLNSKQQDRFKIARKMLAAGFRLFGQNPYANAELAIMLIDERVHPDCLAIIDARKSEFASIVCRLSGDETGGLAEYYHWVREDLAASEFLKSKLGLVRAKK